jgi:hypothetical protein
MKEVGGISKTFSNAATEDKTGLVTADQERDHRPEPVSEHFGKTLNCGVLKSTGAEIPHLSSIILLGEENKVGPIDGFKIRGVVMETLKQINHASEGDRPCVALKNEGPKPSGPGLAVERIE